MSENIEELAEAQVRIENKMDDGVAVLNKLDEVGLFEIVKNIKRFLWFIIITISGGTIWIIMKDIFLFYIKRKIEGVAP